MRRRDLLPMLLAEIVVDLEDALEAQAPQLRNLPPPHIRASSCRPTSSP